MSPLLLGSINPGHSDVLKDDDESEWQGGRVVIEHGDKVVSGALDEQQPHEECKDTAAHYREPGGRCGGKGAGWVGPWGSWGTQAPPITSLPHACLQPSCQQAQSCTRDPDAQVLSPALLVGEQLRKALCLTFIPCLCPSTVPGPWQVLYLIAVFNLNDSSDCSQSFSPPRFHHLRTERYLLSGCR